MTKAAELAKMGEVLTNSQIGGRRNIVINGAMQVAQRGTSFTLENASAKYPVDRFFVQDVNSSSGEATVSQSTTAPTDFKNSLKIDVTTADTSLAAGDQYKIEYRIEGQDISHLNFGTSSAQTVTLSFYIRSNKTGNTSVALLNNDNDRAYVATFTIDSANTFERKEITIAGDQSGTWLDTNGIGLRLRWGSFGSTFQTSSVNQWQANQVMSTNSSPINFFDSTDNELYLTGVQLEVGTATPFEHRSFGEELALCQRYYYKSMDGSPADNIPNTDNTSSNGQLGIAMYSATAGRTPYFQNPVQMRADPSVTVYSSERANTSGKFGLFNQTSWVATSDTSPTVDIGRVTFSITHGSNLTAGYTYLLAGGFDADAEL
jgi:hypothetical protein